LNTGYNKERPTHTIIKADLEELNLILLTNDSTLIERKVKEIQKLIEHSLQLFPDSSFILDSDAAFSEILKRSPAAIESLKKAFKLNKRSTYLALRLSRIYEEQNEIDDAVKTLTECLERNPGDKSINYRLSYYLEVYNLGSIKEIKYHLRRSFTIGDDNYVSQFWFARSLYIDGDHAEALEIFQTLKNLNIDNRIKKKIRGYVLEDKQKKRFSGTISKLESSYAFIMRDGENDRMFSHVTSNDKKAWDMLSVGKRVVFNLAFNYRGPQAMNVQLESEN